MAKRKNVSGTAADPVVQFSKLEIDGETYRLAYSFNAIAIAENLAGCNLLSGLENLTDLTALQLRGLLYAALIVADPTATIGLAASLVRLDTIGIVTGALAEAYVLSMPAKKQDPLQADAPAVQVDV